MVNKANYIKFYKSIPYTARPRKLTKIRHNSEKWGCDSFQ